MGASIAAPAAPRPAATRAHFTPDSLTHFTSPPSPPHSVLRVVVDSRGTLTRRIVPGSTTFRHSKLRYSNHLPARGSPLRARQSIKAASLSRIENGQRGTGGEGAVGGNVGAAADRLGYGYEALSAASDGSDQEPEDVPEYTPFDMELSGGGESAEGPSSRGSAKVNFPPDVELERRATSAFGSVLHRGRGRSMSAWSDISRSSIRFEERRRGLWRPVRALSAPHLSSATSDLRTGPMPGASPQSLMHSNYNFIHSYSSDSEEEYENDESEKEYENGEDENDVVNSDEAADENDKVMDENLLKDILLLLHY
ncbi:unnamed protein product [Colias eurytheme]|nr:unnamed protein product [Colias eurytheme]